MTNAFCILLIAVLTSYQALYRISKSTFQNPVNGKNHHETLAETSHKLLPDIPKIGSISELGKDETCDHSGDILVYAETIKYRIYVCGDETNNQPQSMIFFTKGNDFNKTVISENPSIEWSDRSYSFHNQKILYRLDRPNSIKPWYTRHLFFFSLYDLNDRSLNTIISEDKIQLYLFNEKIVPNYRKTILSPDDQAKNRFLKFLPTLKNQFAVCSNAYEGRIITWKIATVRAYEIAPRKYLVEIICDTRTYNPLTQYILYSEESSEKYAKPVPFYTLTSPRLDTTMEERQTIGGVSQFFPEDNTLRVYVKEIGAGGWGNAQEYKLIEDRFELQEYREYPSSGNARPKSPEEFPKIYP